MMFELLLKGVKRACEIPTLKTPSTLPIFDGSKPMILPFN